MDETPTLASPVKEAIQKLQQKIISLLEKHRELKEALNTANRAVHAAKEENEQLKHQIRQKEEVLRTLKHQFKMNKIANSATNTTEAKKTLTKYINEIDKCIAQLME